MSAFLSGCSQSDPGDAPRSDAGVPSADAHWESDARFDADGTADAEDATTSNFPALLSQTGLFSDIGTRELGRGVRAFTPAFQLWSDGADKQRWLYLPPGTQIDTSSMDYWRYPAGTKAWKEFRRDGVLVETRLLEKLASGEWTMIAYQWRADTTDAEAVPSGVKNANGTEHDIPAQKDCKTCHGNMPDVLLGVTALQLSTASGITLQDLVRDGLVSQPPTNPLTIPGDDTARAALGYLHANCGHCHNPRSKLWATLDVRFWLPTEPMATVADAPSYTSTVGIEPAVPWGGATSRIELGHPEGSTVFLRMQSRGNRLGDIQLDMPPLATEKPDAQGLALIGRWITEMGADGGP